MEPRFESLKEIRLTGMKLPMSLADNKTAALWSRFMPRRQEIKNKAGTELYSVQIYDPLYFDEFSPTREFEKWAAMPVNGHGEIPEGMEPLGIPGGEYAVFFYRGAASRGPEVFGYIFGEWLPKSGYLLDNRPHFEILGEKYKNEDPESEEEIWIPVRLKKLQ